MKMRARSMILSPLIIFLFGVAPLLAKAPYQTDIAMQGPWILYKDRQFKGPKGRNITVLIAIAPWTAVDPKDIGLVNNYASNPKFHRPPQLSTGDGYFITQPGVYCLTFVSDSGTSQCAPSGSHLRSGNYRPDELLKLPHPGKHWNWRATVDKQMALVLPMPDSWSNDGDWPVRFAPAYDPNGKGYFKDAANKNLNPSTGLILHYLKGPNGFDLLACDAPTGENTSFGVINCQKTVKPQAARPITYLKNSGTLRLQMKAPFIADGCDRHARMAYREMFGLTGTTWKDHAVIEPAYYKDPVKGLTSFEDDPNGTHFCFAAEKNDHDGMELLNANAGADAATVVALESVLSSSFVESVTDFDKEIIDLNPLQDAAAKFDLADLNEATQALKEAAEIKDKLDPVFPRISQPLRIATLLQVSAAAFAKFDDLDDAKLKNKKGTDGNDLQTTLSGFVKTLQPYNGPPTKSGGDCGVMLIQVTDLSSE
jgi:hypothetical protein